MSRFIIHTHCYKTKLWHTSMILDIWRDDGPDKFLNAVAQHFEAIRVSYPAIDVLEADTPAEIPNDHELELIQIFDLTRTWVAFDDDSLHTIIVNM